MKRLLALALVLLLFCLPVFADYDGGPIPAEKVSVDTDNFVNIDNTVENLQETLEDIDDNLGGGGGSGDVTDVGDCTEGACLDGSSDGGTYVRLYDGDSHYLQLTPADLSDNRIVTFGDLDLTFDQSVANGASPTFGSLIVNTLLDVNEDIDIDFDAADEEIVITQSSSTATQGAPLIYVDDNRGGPGGPDEKEEATLMLDALGLTALYIKDGNAYFGLLCETQFDGNTIYNNTIVQFKDDVTAYWGTGYDFKFGYDTNGTGDALMVLAPYTPNADDTTHAIWMLGQDSLGNNPNNMTDHDDYTNLSLIMGSQQGADENDYVAVVIGMRAQADVSAPNYFDLYSMVGSTDGSLDATTTELAPMFRSGKNGTGTSDHSLGAGDWLHEGKMEVDGVLYPDGGVSTASTIEGGTLTEGGNDVWNATETDIIKNSHIDWADIDYLTEEGAAINEAYGSGWNADVGPPEKDDVYDYLVSFDSDADGSFTDESWHNRVVELKIFADDTAVATGDGKLHIFIPPELNGMNLVDADAGVSTVSSSGLPSVAIYNVTDSQDMLSTNITIDANEKTSYTAATAPAINGSYDDVATGDELRIDVDAAGTGTKGLTVMLSFRTP